MAPNLAALALSSLSHPSTSNTNTHTSRSMHCASSSLPITRSDSRRFAACTRLLQKQSENEGQMVDAVSREILSVVMREAKHARENYLQLSNDLRAVRDEMGERIARLESQTSRSNSNELWAVRDEICEKIARFEVQTSRVNSTSARSSEIPESESPEVPRFDNEPRTPTNREPARTYWPDVDALVNTDSLHV